MVVQVIERVIVRQSQPAGTIHRMDVPAALVNWFYILSRQRCWSSLINKGWFAVQGDRNVSFIEGGRSKSRSPVLRQNLKSFGLAWLKGLKHKSDLARRVSLERNG